MQPAGHWPDQFRADAPRHSCECLQIRRETEGAASISVSYGFQSVSDDLDRWACDCWRGCVARDPAKVPAATGVIDFDGHIDGLHDLIGSGAGTPAPHLPAEPWFFGLSGNVGAFWAAE